MKQQSVLLPEMFPAALWQRLNGAIVLHNPYCRRVICMVPDCADFRDLYAKRLRRHVSALRSGKKQLIILAAVQRKLKICAFAQRDGMGLNQGGNIAFVANVSHVYGKAVT